MSHTITSRLTAKAIVSVRFEEPIRIDRQRFNGKDVALTRATFAQDHNHSAIYGSGSGNYYKKDGSIGQQTASVYSLNVTDLPDEVQGQVFTALATQLRRVSLADLNGGVL